MKKKITGIIIICMMVFCPLASISAQGISLNADLVSNYVWRGQMIHPNPNIQPSVSYGTQGEIFTIGAWGSYGIGSYYSEINLYASLSFGPVTLSLTDYFVDTPFNSPRFFDYRSSSTVHILEVAGKYVISEQLPLTATWATFIYGDDSNDQGQRFYSSYAELSYGFNVEDVSVQCFVGVTPWESYYADGFNPVNIGFGAEKSIVFSDNFQMPLGVNLTYNPYENRMFMVVSASF